MTRPALNKIFLCLVAISLLTVILSSSVSAAKRAKPIIAVKKAKLGEGLSKYAIKHLNLTSLLDEMEASIQRNRKFDLVSRKKSVLKEIREEQKFAQSDLTAGNAAAEGQIKNANFLILSTVQDFKFYRSSKAVPNLEDKYVRVDSGMLEVNSQVVDTATGAIKATFYLKSRFSTKKKVVNSKGGVPSSVYFTKMAKAVAGKMTDQLVDFVFPMKVINVKGNKVYINRGKDGGLKKGQRLNVYKPGMSMIDPDTGENLGSAETLIGEVVVSRINPKFTITEIGKKGLDEDAERGDIVRAK